MTLSLEALVITCGSVNRILLDHVLCKHMLPGFQHWEVQYEEKGASSYHRNNLIDEDDPNRL